MSDSSMVERWNAVVSADMAVSAEGLLARYTNRKRMPYDAEEALDRAIAFLDEAGSGGAIICGNAKSSGFTGTLSPLRWSTDVYIEVSTGKENEQEVELFQEIVKALNGYKEVLERIRDKKTVDVESSAVKKTHEFFRDLADVLLSEADPVAKSFSHPFS